MNKDDTFVTQAPNYKTLKKSYLALSLILFTVTVFGQSNFYRLSAGGGGGGTYSFTDVKKGNFGFGGYGTLDYHFTPFITAGLELQMGLIKGGDRFKDPYNREFTNAYRSVTLNAKFRAGEFTDFHYSNFLNYTKGFYLGTGVGVISNNMNKIVRYKGTHTYPGDDKSTNMVIPLNIGIDFYLPDGWGDIRYTFNINYQANVTIGEGLDGYNDAIASGIQNRNPDIYNFFSIGFKYSFGPKGLTHKTIR